MNYTRRILAFLLVIAMSVCALLPLTSCGETENPPACTQHVDTDNNGKCDKCDANVENENPDGEGGNGGTATNVTYTVSVKTLGGMALEGIMCYVHKGDGYNSVGRAETNENGIATFNLPRADDYSVELDGVPDGYNVKSGDTKDERYAFTTTGVAITLTSAPIEGKIPSSYEVGDVIHDFEVTTIDGETLRVSEILEEKKMILLNFWFSTCGPCKVEFPYMNSAYGKYSDKVEIIAINDNASPNETLASTKAFRDDLGLSFPVVHATDQKLGDAIAPDPDERYYPMSAVIDRYGVICLIEIVSVDSEKKFINLFEHLTADNYVQTLYESFDELTPIEKPTQNMESSDKFSEAFDGGILDAYYYPDTMSGNWEYSWPFVIDEYKGEACVRPSNADKDNSFATLYIDVNLEAGQALAFDYYSVTEKDSDVLVVVVDKKDMFVISGVQENDEWSTCYAFVAQETKKHQVALVYSKDAANGVGEDTVYLKNLRVTDASEIKDPTYIYRYAATNPTDNNAGYKNYTTVVYNENDGFFHAHTADGPLLMVNVLGYTRFDSNKTLAERLYTFVNEETGTYEFMVNDENKFNLFEMYANFTSNSKFYGYTPVTMDLKELLVEYTNKVRRSAGKDPHENLWLQLCSYYDAYGENVTQMENPTKGLSTFDSYEAVLGENSVTYSIPIIPRGYLYKFVPSVSGVYRVTSHSEADVDGWIFTGESRDWATVDTTYRNVLVDGELGERYCEELFIYEEDGSLSIDYTNVSLVAYLEAGTPYYIDIAYDDIYGQGTFTFDIKFLGENFTPFVSAAPGSFSFELNADGTMGNTTLGLNYINAELCTDENDRRYGYYCQKLDDGSLGEIIYADFVWFTSIFPSQSIMDLLELGAFNFQITDTDREAISLLNRYTEDELREMWGDSFDANWAYYQMDDIKNSIYHGKAKDALDYEAIAIIKQYRDDVGELMLDDLKAAWGDSFEQKWAYYRMDDVLAGVFHGEGEEDMSHIIEEYALLIDKTENAVERNGCVAVTEELAEVLQKCVDKYVFEGVEDSWLKFCYYYKLNPTKGAN